MTRPLTQHEAQTLAEAARLNAEAARILAAIAGVALTPDAPETVQAAHPTILKRERERLKKRRQRERRRAVGGQQGTCRGTDPPPRCPPCPPSDTPFVPHLSPQNGDIAPLASPKDRKLASLLPARGGDKTGGQQGDTPDPHRAARREALEDAGIFGEPLAELTACRLLRPSDIKALALRLKRDDKGPGIVLAELRKQVAALTRNAEAQARRRQETEAHLAEVRRRNEATRAEQEAAEARHRAVIDAATDAELEAAVDRVLAPLGVTSAKRTRERYSSIRALATSAALQAAVATDLSPLPTPRGVAAEGQQQ